MPKVAVSIQSFPTYTACVFMEAHNTHQQVGPVRHFRDDQLVMEMLRRAHASLETLNLVETALTEHRTCWITLDLTDEQYIACSRRAPRKKK